MGDAVTVGRKDINVRANRRHPGETSSTVELLEEMEMIPLSRSFPARCGREHTGRSTPCHTQGKAKCFLHIPSSMGTPESATRTVGGNRKTNDRSLFQGCLKPYESFQATCAEVQQMSEK